MVGLAFQWRSRISEIMITIIMIMILTSYTNILIHMKKAGSAVMSCGGRGQRCIVRTAVTAEPT